MSGQEVAGMLHDYGEDWQIQSDSETGIWTAVRYPTPTATRVLVGRDATDLRSKLDAVTGKTGRPSLKRPATAPGKEAAPG